MWLDYNYIIFYLTLVFGRIWMQIGSVFLRCRLPFVEGVGFYYVPALTTYAVPSSCHMKQTQLLRLLIPLLAIYPFDQRPDAPGNFGQVLRFFTHADGSRFAA